MATLTVRNLEDAVVKALRIRAAEHCRSAEAEHRDILKAALMDAHKAASRVASLDRLAEFRQRVSGRDSDTTAELLDASRQGRNADLMNGRGLDAGR